MLNHVNMKRLATVVAVQQDRMNEEVRAVAVYQNRNNEKPRRWRVWMHDE